MSKLIFIPVKVILFIEATEAEKAITPNAEDEIVWSNGRICLNNVRNWYESIYAQRRLGTAKAPLHIDGEGVQGVTIDYTLTDFENLMLKHGLL